MNRKSTKHRLLLCIILWGAAGTAPAQDLDARVKQAVDALVARYNTPITVSVAAPTIGGTDSVSAFSGYLSGIIERCAINNTLYQVAEPTRGAPPIRSGGGQRGNIKGRYELVGDQVEVTLTLITEPEGNRVAAASFRISREELEKLNISVLPENRKTPAEVQTQAALFENIPLSPPPAPSPPGELTAQIWPDKESRTYVDGETMSISLYASRDCWFKVYHIDVDNRMRLIYPNQNDRNNTLKANTLRVIPENTVFQLGAPYGEETILAVFSDRPFENLEAELSAAIPATRESISRAAGQRGLSVQTKAAASPQETSRAARFSYTIVPAGISGFSDLIEETFVFKRPADAAGAIQLLRDEVISRNGTFTGNEREGSWAADDMRGSYRLNAGEVVLVIRRGPRQSAISRIPGTRGGDGGFNFTFDKPADVSSAVAAVKTAIEKKGGRFTGDIREGNFKASGIAGHYAVLSRVSVTIQEKPFIIPNQLIEREVKNYFGAP
jgi:hypothetical protein